MSRLTFALAAALTLTALPAFAQTGALTTRAMPSCSPGDTVVWENTETKAYHLQGDTYFGTTKHGKYACKSAADSAGYHAAGMHAGSHSSMRRSPGAMNGTGASNASGAVAPATGDTPQTAPDASGTGTPTSSKHHHRKHKGMASPGPMSASPYPAATQ